MSVKKALHTYRRNIYSQCGEDGVVAEILKRLGIETGWFCEFGAWDGKYGSNTYSLLLKGWNGVMIEGDPSKFKILEKTAKKFSNRLVVMNRYVSDGGEFLEKTDGSENTLDNLLNETKIPKNFEVLSVDIDSYDYQVWKSLEGYRPQIVIIEIDSSTLPEKRYVYKGGGRLTSFTSMLELGLSKGYTLVCHTGNLVFVIDELITQLQISQESIENPSSLFISDWVSPTKTQVLVRKLRNLTWQRVLIKFENQLTRMARLL